MRKHKIRMVAMVTKTLKKMEVDLGFVRIPSKNRAELIGNTPTPFDTNLNAFPAKVDKYGRIWSDYLKNRFPVNTEVTLSRNESGFQVIVNGLKQESAISESAATKEEGLPVSETIQGANGTWYKVLEGDCIKYLNENAIGNVHLTYFDPPYLQGIL
jgi:hypothetical protein